MKDKKIPIQRLDHLVLTVNDLEKTIVFYTEVLDMDLISFGDNRKALKFGDQKINLHIKGEEIEPKATIALPGTADLCLITSIPLNDVKEILEFNNLKMYPDIIKRTGALGDIRSIYARDPDQNLIEISSYNF
ncbi:Glyoxalase [Tenacibaculum sp. 190130A14a]|uniref:Virulence protein STM3117 n=1 Tax=Tenacibaculum polynesiense TaxID=3137857 RepID=A0ABP1EXS7_9FLAO